MFENGQMKHGTVLRKTSSSKVWCTDEDLGRSLRQGFFDGFPTDPRLGNPFIHLYSRSGGLGDVILALARHSWTAT